MSRFYDKEELKKQLGLEQIYDLLDAWNGSPEYTEKGIVSQTICHHTPDSGSRKLYYYSNGDTGIFHCYTECGSFDIFDLCIKVMKIQRGLDWELYDAMDYIASYFGFSGKEIEDKESQLKDWQVFKRHDIRITTISEKIQLREFNPVILTRFSYPRIDRWEREGILPEVSKKNLIGYYPGGEQITIPHFDIDGRLIGIRGRTLVQDEADRYGKYRPLLIGKTLYNHPLSMNLYHLNKSKDNIKRTRSAIIFEAEKTCLQMESWYGEENDISVACCGSSISNYQMMQLLTLGVNEVIIAFDRQFIEIGDDEFKKLKAKLIHLYNKYNTSVKITAIFDKTMILPYKSSPLDCGPKKFEFLLRERIEPHE